MSIIRGMFRISIVVAIVLGIVGAIAVHIATIREQDRALNSWKEDTRIWNALRCGGQFLGKDMTAFTNQYGNIDIGRAGCSTASFIANFDEIREALNAPAPPKMTFNYWEVFWREALPLLMLVFIAFLGVNILGFAYLGARLIVRWVWAGFRSA